MLNALTQNDLKTLRELEDLFLKVPPDKQDFFIGYLRGTVEMIDEWKKSTDHKGA